MLPENWKRLADLRDKYDPDGVFFGYFDGLSEPKPS
jgi:FAD/FMN-containing dehydrogenase